MNAFRTCEYLWAGWLIIWAFQSKRTQQRESMLSRLSYAILGVIATYLLFLDSYLGAWLQGDIFRRNQFTEWSAVVITVLGLAITIWARYTLGGNWSGNVTVKVEHELIRSGPYRWVRHPIYTGILIAAIGTSLARDEGRAILGVILLWAAYVIKLRKEEQFMRQTFGAAHEEYASRTGALLPQIRRASSPLRDTEKRA